MDPSYFLCLATPEKPCVYETSSDRAACVSGPAIHSWAFERPTGEFDPVPDLAYGWRLHTVSAQDVGSIFQQQLGVQVADIDAVCSVVHSLLSDKYVNVPRRLDPVYKRLAAPEFTFVDIHGGPGGCTEYLQYRLPKAKGFGLTPSNGWNLALMDQSRFTPFFVRTGNVLDEGPLFSSFVLAREAGGVDLAVCSGSVNGGLSMEIATPLFVAELTAAMTCLREGGSLVFFLPVIPANRDDATLLTQFLYALYLCFEVSGVLQPVTSAYPFAVCKRRRNAAVVQEVLSNLLTPVDNMPRTFIDSLRSIVEDLSAERPTLPFDSSKFSKIWNIPSMWAAKQPGEVRLPPKVPSTIVGLVSPSRIPGTVRPSSVVPIRGPIYVGKQPMNTDGIVDVDVNDSLSPDYMPYDNAESLTNYFSYAGVPKDLQQPEHDCVPIVEWYKRRDEGYRLEAPSSLPLANCYIFDDTPYSLLDAKIRIYVPAYVTAARGVPAYEELRRTVDSGQAVNLYADNARDGTTQFSEKVYNEALQDREQLISQVYILGAMLTGLL
jgi:hypothetical protein